MWLIDGRLEAHKRRLARFAGAVSASHEMMRDLPKLSDRIPLHCLVLVQLCIKPATTKQE